MFKISLIIILSIIILKFSGSSIINTQTITILLGNYEITAQQGFIFLTVILLILFLILITYLLIGFSFFTKHQKIMSNNNKTSMALDSMVDCITLTNLGDYSGSQKALKQINKNLANHPIINLLNIQSHNIVKNKKAINKNFEALLNNAKTKNFALQGLAILAKKDNDLEKAEHYLEESYQEVPYAINTILVLLETYKNLQNWEKLIRLINENYKKKTIDKNSYDKDLALAYLMIYLKENDNEAEELNDSKILDKNKDYLLKAKKLYSNHHQIEIQYARYLFKSNKKSSLTKYVKNIWPHNTHPDIVELFIKNSASKKISVTLKKLEELIHLNPKGEAAIVEYVDLVITNQIYIEKCQKLLTEILKSSNSYTIYEIAIKFYNQFPNDENNILHDDLIKQEENYSFKPYYVCNICNNRYDSWNILCDNCKSYDEIEYHGYSKDKFIA